MSKIVDITGRQVESGNSTGLIDPTGQPISSEPAIEKVGVGGAPAPSSRFVKTGGKVGIKGVVIACLCTDGLFHKVILTEKEGHKIRKLLNRMHKGSIHLQDQPGFMIIPVGGA